MSGHEAYILEISTCFAMAYHITDVQDMVIKCL